MSTQIEKARDFAVHAHRSTNHKYDGQPYEKHLELVVWYAEKYKHLIKGEEGDVIAAAWLHDVIEDCRLTYNDVLQKTNYNVAELVYALTNEKGKTRKERANDKYYAGIRKVRDGIFLKVCDRLANISYSKETGSSMLSAYRKEEHDFVQQLYDSHYKPMFLEMSTLLGQTTTPSPEQK